MPDWGTLFEQLQLFAVPTLVTVLGLFLLGWRGKAQPSALTFGLVLFPVLLWVTSFVLPGVGLILNWYSPVLMLVLLLDCFQLSPHRGQVRFTRALNRNLSISQRNPVQLTIENHSAITINLSLEDSVPGQFLKDLDVLAPPVFHETLEPGERRVVQYQIRPLQRGVYEYGGIHGRIRSRLGLLWLMHQSGRPESVRVVPDLRRVRQLRLQASRAMSLGEIQKRAMGLEGMQFSGIRHYTPGDDIRKISWPATARWDAPVVRTFEPEVEQPVLVLLDASRSMEATIDGLQKFDWAINAALGFLSVAFDRQDRFGLTVFSQKTLLTVPLGTGSGHLSRINSAMSELTVRSEDADYEMAMLRAARTLKQRSLIVIFTDLSDPATSQRLVRSLRSFSRQHILMVVTLKDTQAYQPAFDMPQDALAAYTKGVALDLLAQRKLTALALGHGSRQTLVIDLPPKALDEAVINKYLDIKRSGRL